jgi:hypothetical protein
MCFIKKILIVILSLLVLSSPVHVYLCSEAEIGTNQTCESSYLDEHDHSHHEDASCNTKASCLSNYSCCNLATSGAFSFLFILDYHSLTPFEISSLPLGITKSFYHPPRVHLL